MAKRSAAWTDIDYAGLRGEVGLGCSSASFPDGDGSLYCLDAVGICDGFSNVGMPSRASLAAFCTAAYSKVRAAAKGQ